MPALRLPLLAFSGRDDYRKVLTTQPGGLLGCWPMWESFGTSCGNLEGTASLNGTYEGPRLGDDDIGDGRRCPYFDGNNDRMQPAAAGLDSVWDWELYSIHLWVSLDPSDWLETSNRRWLTMVGHPPYDWMTLRKNNSASGQINFWYRCGGHDMSCTGTVGSLSGWRPAAVTYSRAASRFRCYWNGAYWSGKGESWAASDRTRVDRLTVGCSNAFTEFTRGWLAHVAVWTCEQTPTEISALGKV